MDKVTQIIKHLSLKPHPEGGYYKEIYRCNIYTLINKSGQNRSLSTSIYYLLLSDQVSLLHELKSDEIWYHHLGSQLTIHCFDYKSGYKKLQLGSKVENEEMPQVIIPAGTIFGAEVNGSNTFVLTGCMVSPGFDFNDFKMTDRTGLLEKFPDYKEIIVKLTKL